MPRLRRHVTPGALIHIIVRFVNHEYLLDDEEVRREYLRRARDIFRRSDWIALSFALMSTHTHFGAIAGEHPFAALSRPLHVGFVLWLNRRRGRLGGGIANRPATYEVAPERAASLLAYHHNNPVRAGAAASAADSDWTSFRHYVDGTASDWLDVPLGLSLAGFDTTPNGRRDFAAFVDDNVANEFGIADDELAGVRRRARRELGTSIELGQPRIGAEISVPLWSPDGARVARGNALSLECLAAAVAARCQIAAEALTSVGRRRHVTRARRIFVLLATRHAGRSLTSSAAFLGISPQAACQSTRRADEDEFEIAADIARSLAVKANKLKS